MSRIARGNLLDENAIVAVLGMFDFLEGNLPADFAAIFSNDLFGRSPEKLSQLGDFLLADPDESRSAAAAVSALAARKAQSVRKPRLVRLLLRIQHGQIHNNRVIIGAERNLGQPIPGRGDNPRLDDDEHRQSSGDSHGEP